MDWITDRYGNLDNIYTLHTMEDVHRLHGKPLADLLILKDFSFATMDEDVSPFLLYLRRYLTANGRILILSYNRLGLCFFAGVPEQHTHSYFEGIEGYPLKDSYPTYSKEEWESILSCTDYRYRFFYPYPNHQAPQEIFSDDTICSYGYGRSCVNVFGRRYRLFDENFVARSLSNADVMADFANSFAIELNARDPFILYAKYSLNRKEEYRILTSVIEEDEKRYVTKRALSSSGQNHINQVYNNTKNDELHLLPASMLDGRTIAYNYLDAPSLEDQMLLALQAHDAGRMAQLWQMCYDFISEGAKIQSYCSEQFAEVFGIENLEGDTVRDLCVSPANVDLILENIYLVPDEKNVDADFVAIDGEWIFDFAVPVAFIFWRAICGFYVSHPEAERVLPWEKLFQRYQITDDKITQFTSWNLHFTNEYVGGEASASYDEDVDPLSLDDIRRLYWPGRRIVGAVYWLDNASSSYSEENSLYQEAERLEEHVYRISWNLDELPEVAFLRLDLQKNQICRAKIIATEGLLELRPMGKYYEKDTYEYFCGTDTSYLAKISGDVKRISVTYEIYESSKELISILEERESVLRRGIGKIRRLLRRG